MLLLWVLACGGLPECEDLCAQRADCIEAEVAAAGSTWSDWTGARSRADWEGECYAVFEDSWAEGGDRGDLRDLCDAEQRNLCDP